MSIIWNIENKNQKSCKTSNEKTDLLFLYLRERWGTGSLHTPHSTPAQWDLPELPHNAPLPAGNICGGLCEIFSKSVHHFLSDDELLAGEVWPMLSPPAPEKSCWLEPSGTSEQKLVIQYSPTINKLELAGT